MAGQPRDNMLPAGFSNDKWANSQATKAKLAAAKKSAWTQFTNQFPNADKNQFVVQEYTDERHNISAEMFFKEGPGSLQSVFGSDRKYWTQRMKTALGLTGVEGFPYQLSPLKKNSIANPCGEFHRSGAKHRKNL